MPAIAEGAVILRIVNEVEWDLSGMRDRARAQRLLRAISPESIVDRVASEAIDPQLTSGASWRWQPGETMAGCSRAIAIIPLARDTFDDLINGRCGYRAQYYLSISDGQHFNRMLVDALCDAVKRIFEHDPKPPDWPVVERSLTGPQSKIWVHCDSKAFPDALQGEFSPQRWAHRSHTVWLRAPLPQHLAIDLKGTWLADKDRSYQTDCSKADRDKTLHETGGA